MISDELARASYKGDNSQCPSPHLGMDYTALVTKSLYTHNTKSLVLFQAREAAKPKVEAKVIEEEIVHEDNEWGKRTFDLSVIFWIYIVM